MKKAIIALVACLALFIGVFFFLLSQAGPENAPQEVKVIELPDTFEK